MATELIRRQAIVVILAFVAFIVIYEVLTSHGSSSAPQYDATVRSVVVLPNNCVRVFLSIENVGNAPGAPDCGIIIQPVDQYGDDLDGDGIGDMTGDHTVQLGATYSGYMDIVVSDNDARYVTSTSMVQISNC